MSNKIRFSFESFQFFDLHNVKELTANCDVELCQTDCRLECKSRSRLVGLDKNTNIKLIRKKHTKNKKK